MRVRLAWFSAVPLALLGAQLAHVVDYRLIEPSAHERTELLAGTGHAYFSYGVFFIALIGAATVAGFVAQALAAYNGRSHRAPRCLPLVLLPVLTFVFQEHLERVLHDGHFPWTAALEPIFLLGLALQLPIALAMYWVARLLLRTAQELGRAFAEAPTAPVLGASPLWVVTTIVPPRTVAVAAGHAGRGPPMAIGVDL